MKTIKLICSLVLLPFVIGIKSIAQVPQVDWSSYFGGQLTIVQYVRYDTTHQEIVIAGLTADTTGIATIGAHKESILPLEPPLLWQVVYLWKTDVFIAKFDYEGSLIWSTYYGGENTEFLSDLAIDRLGNIYICGGTSSTSGISTMDAHLPMLTLLSPQIQLTLLFWQNSLLPAL